jgi:hypothetical protein
VVEIDGKALAGCADVTVYGEKGSAAERFAAENGFAFAEIGGTSQEPAPAREEPPMVLPFVPR